MAADPHMGRSGLAWQRLRDAEAINTEQTQPDHEHEEEVARQPPPERGRVPTQGSPHCTLKRLMAEREITQTEAAKLVGVKQPNISKLLQGQFKLVSVEKLLRMLAAFDQDVEIKIKPHRKRGEGGRITFIRA
ncbi:MULTISPECIES: helix-turn-helix domain-containing protein [Bradyrhizobium]|uniref:helix-turn-helix domain-containing protein n=1 Tax=Bradyrhizobium TaxID=374 RepID=UPI001FE35040|nr:MULTISPECIES: XRE family transcriptional regulator [Bradyrhizobium]MCS3764705.1 putative XRE-type DNA-binding protein [Bradyrhizobium centrosematis]MCS3776243.1 putative XRE-type DNA-binding protein [Bradyrhizobium centrosematis]